MTSPSKSCGPGLLLAAAALLLPAIAGAQASGDGYAFGRPHASVTIRGGVAQPMAGGQLFDDVRDQLTLGSGSFTTGTLGVDVDIRLLSRVNLQLGGTWGSRTSDSHFRDFTDTDDQEIEQRTKFTRVPLTAGLKVHLVEPGRAVGSLAWIPRKLVPYVGAGGGVMYYRFEQKGDFVDFENLDVFRSTLRTSGWAPGGYLNTGIDLAVRPTVGLVTDLRYDFARGPTRDEFELYDRIDLSGLSASVGLSFRF